jgi:hypothetical protein
MLRRHTGLSLSIEAHCGLEPDQDFARHFTQRRAMAVRQAMESVVRHDGAPGELDGRLVMRAWGNSRPLVIGYGEEGGAQNRRVEIYMKHGDFEVPRRRPLSAYVRNPRALPLGGEAQEPEHEPEEAPTGKVTAGDDETMDTVEAANFDADDSSLDLDNDHWGQVMVQLPDGQRVVLPAYIWQQLEQLPPAQVMPTLLYMMAQQNEDNGTVEIDEDEDEDGDEAGLTRF